MPGCSRSQIKIDDKVKERLLIYKNKESNKIKRDLTYSEV